MVWRIAWSSSAMTMRALAIAREALGGGSGGHRVEGVHEMRNGSAYEFGVQNGTAGLAGAYPEPWYFAAKCLQYSRLPWRRTLPFCVASRPQSCRVPTSPDDSASPASREPATRTGPADRQAPSRPRR